MSDRIAVRLRIEGRVQGVGYRDWLAGRATRAGLDGWVRNRDDGSVEALLAGPAAAVQAVAVACARGPAPAGVHAVSPTPADDPGPTGFGRCPPVFRG